MLGALQKKAEAAKPAVAGELEPRRLAVAVQVADLVRELAEAHLSAAPEEHPASKARRARFVRHDSFASCSTLQALSRLPGRLCDRQRELRSTVSCNTAIPSTRSIFSSGVLLPRHAWA